MARVPVDIRLIFDDEVPESIDVLRFIESEARRLNTGGRAGYMMQLATAAYLARRGDMSLAGLFSPAAASPAAPPPKDEPPANTGAVDSALNGMF